LIPLVTQNAHLVVNKVENYRVLLVGVLSQSASYLLDKSALMLSRVRKADSIESWDIESFICKLRSQDASNSAVPEFIKDSFAVSLSACSRKYFAWLLHKISDPFKMLNSSAKDKAIISSSDLFIRYLRNLPVTVVVPNQRVEQGAPVERPSVDGPKSSLDGLDFQLDRA
jgi:hypothetical protein